MSTKTMITFCMVENRVVLFAVQSLYSVIAKVLRSLGGFFHEMELAGKRKKKWSLWGLVVHGQGKPGLIGNILEPIGEEDWQELLLDSLCHIGEAKVWEVEKQSK